MVLAPTHSVYPRYTSIVTLSKSSCFYSSKKHSLDYLQEVQSNPMKCLRSGRNGSMISMMVNCLVPHSVPLVASIIWNTHQKSLQSAHAIGSRWWNCGSCIQWNILAIKHVWVLTCKYHRNILRVERSLQNINSKKECSTILTYVRRKKWRGSSI